ncbi:cation transport regulator ChaC [Pedobacter sp. AK017]|uniref:plasmid mobilization relaxosome protein MobC n=1 Tax=Pedobacter sp. AK017 TaxID=2723073 RepID=UPI00161BBCDA|nr:plasmid mobilization relaxosome protein MobC [Pedobacter sp. AK017]MBB5440632.1 cation transport regulator ChaC [Pedobacter sp. AK017]
MSGAEDPGSGKPAADTRTRRFELRLTEDEFNVFVALEKSLGMSRADIVRIRVLKNSDVVLVNARELLGLLDSIGTELGRSGNNINQLARHANILRRQGMLEAQTADEFNHLFKQYIFLQTELEKSFRQLLRLMTRRRS